MAIRTAPKKPSRKHASKRVSSRSLKHGSKRQRERRRGPVRTWLRKWWWLWAPPIVLGLIGAGALVYLYVTIPLPPERVLAQTTFLFDREGERLTTLDGPEDRSVVDLERVPDHVRQAVLAAEDARFYDHPGISIVDIIRAGWVDLTGGRTTGASTVTQQLVRNVFPEVGTERTITRKIKEAILALKLERELDKNEILERYLNTIYLGDGTYGFQAASRHYFGKPVAQINVLQAATLAGIIARPEGFNPRVNPENSIVRRNYVLDRMAELGYLTRSRAERLKQRPVKTRNVEEGFADSPAAWFIDYTRQWLTNVKLSPLEDPREQTYQGGLRIRSTIDMQWQEAAIAAIKNRYSYEGAPDAALVAIDPHNGEIRAVASSLDYSADPDERAFHPATFGCNLARGCGWLVDTNGDGEKERQSTTGRQTGSAFKIFTVGAAVEDGVHLRSTFSGASPIRLDEPPCGSEADPWEPQNFGGSSYGSMDLYGATQSSVNTVFAQLIEYVGPEKVVDYAHRMGISSKIPEFCSITLGAVEVNVLEMTSAVATLANGGVRHEPTPVGVIRSPDNEVIWKNDGQGERVMDENEAWQTVDALEGVMNGTAAGANFGVPAFGKTGSEDDATDGWFCGSTSELTACVWVGHHEGQIPIPGLTGGGWAAPVWRDFMVAAHQGLQAQSFPTPELTGELAKPKVPVPAPSSSAPSEPEKEKPEKPERPDPEPTEPPEPPPSPEPSPPPTPTPSPTEAVSSEGRSRPGEPPEP
ncbi:MAG TPA: transglycosylase domain-containing protein [Actinomycetota bacterium]|nr:transglycosylase domain-containing protein [Actinomycetota bacterium]